MLRRWIGFVSIWFVCAGSAIAQSVSTVSADGSLGTQVSGSESFSVTEGTVRTNGEQATLFHSFEAFSPANSNVTFDLTNSQNTINTQQIDLIISRVTGDRPSFINGQLSIVQDAGTPTPDLFLINPQGIEFGAEARLKLPGSFLASTASGVTFGESVFSTSDLSLPPLLTVSAPVGLQLNHSAAGAAAGITVHGNGHQLSTQNPIFAPYLPTGANEGLSVEMGKTLALIGRNVHLKGGVVNAPGGRAEVGGAADGSVLLRWDGEQPLSVDYDPVVELGSVRLTERSLISTSATASGAIQLQGSQVELEGGSMVWAQNRGLSEGAPISVRATEKLTLTGATPTVDAVSGILTETVAPGDSGTVTVSSPKIVVSAGANLGSRAFSLGNSGTVTITADSLLIEGHVPIAPSVFSRVGTTALGAGAAGDVTGYFTTDLSVTSGGYFGSTTAGSGRGGDVTIQADTVNVVGATPTGLISLVTASSADKGDSGNLSLVVRTLSARDSGVVSTTSLNAGRAGNIDVRASESITLSSSKPGLLSSNISSTVDFPSEPIRLLLGLTGTPEGDAGSILISTPLLSILDEATITVANLANGNAGQLTINVDTLQIKDGAVDAFTAAGEGGNITLNIRDILSMRGGGRISATAMGIGDSGNLTIRSPIIVGIENSDIIANAVTGNGGNINITAKEIFGLTFREALTPESDITASSEFGVSGTVSINGLSFEASSGLVELPEEVSDASDRITKGCDASSRSQFIASGRGGLPISPADALSTTKLWQDTRPVESNTFSIPLVQAASDNTTANTTANTTIPLLVEATSWQHTDNGIVLSSLEPAEGSLHRAQVASCLSQR